jgi:hypothetical protein
MQKNHKLNALFFYLFYPLPHYGNLFYKRFLFIFAAIFIEILLKKHFFSFALIVEIAIAIFFNLIHRVCFNILKEENHKSVVENMKT